MRLEEIFPLHIGKTLAGQSGGELAADEFGNVGGDGDEDVENHLMQRLVPAIVLQNELACFEHRTLDRALAHGLKNEALSLDDGVIGQT